MNESSNWFPVVTYIGNDPVTYCRLLEERVFEAPFFNEGVDHLLLEEANRKQERLTPALIREEQALLEVRGFIFHTAHCGSTLLASMLKVGTSVRVVSETEAINGLLLSLALKQVSRAQALETLALIIKAYQQPMGKKKHLIFKLTSWNIFFADLFQELFPEVKWLYIYRNPQEVVRSLLRSDSGMVSWFFHQSEVLSRHFVGADYQKTTLEAFLQRLMERNLHQFQLHQNDGCCQVEYPDFIRQVASIILPHFNLHFTAQEIAEMSRITAFDAKKMKEVPFEAKEE